MALVISCVAQKGGVGKSTMSRLIAREYAANDWSVKIADMDLQQGTSYRWHQRRLMSGTEPTLSVEQFRDVNKALKATAAADLLVFDEHGPIDNQLRFPDECVRHKILDMVGDFSLAACDISGQLVAHCSGHRLNAELVRALLKEFEIEKYYQRSA